MFVVIVLGDFRDRCDENMSIGSNGVEWNCDSKELWRNEEMMRRIGEMMSCFVLKDESVDP